MRAVKGLVMLAAVALLVIGCKDRAAEKRIAELEARLSAVEGGKMQANPADGMPAQPAAAPETKPEGPLPVAAFEKLEHDFGTIREGEKAVYTYKFKNTGEAPLVIQGVQPSCGCTAPDWTKEPIPVGGTGFVKAEFDSQGKPGIQNKTISVTANTWPKAITLRFKAMVTPKPDGANGPVK